jgi:hypothetical protein
MCDSLDVVEGLQRVQGPRENEWVEPSGHRPLNVKGLWIENAMASVVPDAR